MDMYNLYVDPKRIVIFTHKLILHRLGWCERETERELFDIRISDTLDPYIILNLIIFYIFLNL